MSSSSRSIAAARARRAGETAPPVSGNRPGTSIGSHAAFAPQQYQQQPSPNVRVARGQPPMPQQMHQQQQPQQTGNGLPFSKLSISDAIGLITLRLGRVEQFIIDVENGEQTISHNSTSFIPENSKVIDSSVLTNIINRIDSLEKREPLSNSNEQMLIVSTEIASLDSQVRKFSEEISKSNSFVTRLNETIMQLSKEVIETKEILQNLTIKMDSHVQETNEKFLDYECAIAEIEKNIQIPANVSGLDSETIIFDMQQSQIQDQDHEQEQEHEQYNDKTAILSVDLKNIIKQELANV